MAHLPPPFRGRAHSLPTSLHRSTTVAGNGGPSGPHPIDHALRLRSLWLAYLVAMLFHVDLGLMPCFTASHRKSRPRCRRRDSGFFMGRC